MYVMGRQRQINMPSVWHGRQWSDVVDGDIRNSLLLTRVFSIRCFTFLQGLMLDSP